MNKKMIKASLLAIAFIVSIPLGLMAQDEGFYPYSFARLSYVNGSVNVQRTSDLGYEKGEVNLALVQGDKIGTESGQAEIHFGRRNYLRLGDNTKVEFAVLPTEGQDRINIHLTEGSVYFRVSSLATEKGIEVHTPDASFYVLEEGLYRFDVRLERETQVSVREGSLEAAAEEGSVLVRAQETVTAADGRLLGDPEYGNTRNDPFDDWNGSRDEQLSARSERQYLPSDMGEYQEELDQNGRWTYEQPYGNVWVPNVSSYDDWEPYSYGRWLWYPTIGWNWVSSESWGWPVYHYGRWNWRFGLGWYWIPQSHWGPAWVSWWSDRDYVGWCPLTWYNRPGYLFNNRFYDRWDDRYFSAHNRAMTVVRRDHLQSPDINRHRLGGADLDRIGRVELRGQQPSIRPAVDNARPQAIAARRALADRPGSRNTVNSVAPSRSLSSSRLRQGGVDSAIRSRDRGASQPEGNRNAIARPSVRSDGAGSRTIRTYPSQRTPGSRDASGVASRGSNAVSQSNETRVSRSQSQNSGSSRSSTVRDPQRTRTSGNDSGSSVTRRGEAVKSYPSTTRQGSTNSSSGRSQSRTYSPRSSISRPASRLSAPSSSASRPSPSARSSVPSYSRSGSSRSSSSSTPRSSYSSPSRSGSSSASRPRSSYSAPSRSGSYSGRSYAAPRSSGSSSGRSYSAPRSGGSSGRSYSAPRSGGSSSGRSSGSVRSGRSSSSGRTGSSSGRSGSSSKSSGSSSRSGSARKK